MTKKLKFNIWKPTLLELAQKKRHLVFCVDAGILNKPGHLRRNLDFPVTATHALMQAVLMQTGYMEVICFPLLALRAADPFHGFWRFKPEIDVEWECHFLAAYLT